MKQIKRIIAALLCLTLMLTMAPLTVFAAGERPTDPALIDDKDKTTDLDYDFELYEDLEGEYNGIKYEWNHETKTLFVDGIKPESTLRDFYFEYWKYYFYTEQELEAEAENGNNAPGEWVMLDFQGAHMERLVIGENITTLNGLWFDYDYALQEVTTVENHSGLCIMNCIFLPGVELNIPNSDGVSLSDRAYAYTTCDTLTLPSSVTALGKECFYGSHVRIIDLSNTNITVIPQKCFYGVTELETVLLPPCIEKIEVNAFMDSDIEYITLPSAVVSVGNGIFKGCENLKRADLSRINITELYNTFSGCTSLTDVQLPPMLEKMLGVFSGCSSLKQIDIPESVKYIDDFNGTSLDSLDLPAGLEYLSLGDAGLEKLDLSEYTNGLQIGAFAFENNYSLKEVILPRENFGKIDNNTFESCINLEKVTMYCCTSIQWYAFGVTALKEIEIPDNCTLIEENAFCKCHNLKTVRLPMDLRVIDGGDPFTNCENLETVIYPSRNKLLYNDSASNERTSYRLRANYLYNHGLFTSNENLTVYLYPDTEIEQYCQDFGINYEYIDWEIERNTTADGQSQEDEPRLTTEGTIGNGTFKITEKAERSKCGGVNSRAIEIFANGPLTTTDITCSNGTESNLAEIMTEYNASYIKFMDGTTAVADGLFEDFAQYNYIMYSAYFAPTVATIGERAFRNSGLYDVYLSNGVTDIGEYAFADNNQLIKIAFSNTITEIKEGTFYNTALVKSNYPIRNASAMTYNFGIPESVTKLGKKAFSLDRSNFWMNDEPIGTDTELNRQRYKGGYTTTKGGLTSSGINVVTGPVTFYIPKTVTDIYYDPEHPENNAVAVTDEGYMDDWIMLLVNYGSNAYQYAKMFGLRYTIVNTDVDGNETEEEKNAPPMYDITTPGSEQSIKGKVSTDEWMANNKDSRKTWVYKPTTKTLTINNKGADNNFNMYSFYYSDGTKVKQGDFEVDTLIMKGKFSAIYGAEYKHNNYYTEELPTPMSFFNPKRIDVSSVNITQLFDGAFKDCTRLESITIQAYEQYTGNNIFDNTPSLKNVVFKDNATSVKAGLFKNHKGIQFVEFPESLHSIGANAFNGCTNLQQIVIPDSCVAIGMNAFKSCVSAQSITLGSGLNQIGKDAFTDLLYCEKVTVRTDKIRTDASVIGIDYREIFSNLGTMTDGITLNYADGLDTADFKVFDDKKVKRITLGADINTLKNADCLTMLKTIDLSENNSNFYLDSGALYTKKNILALVPRTAESFTISENCKGIGDGAFCNAAISTIEIPGKVKTIGAYAFANAKNLKSVSLNKGTEEIGDNAFRNCDRLRFIFTPTNLETVGDNAFRNCNKLASVILNDELRSVGASAFSECPKLRGIVIPEHTETIGDKAFADCKGLEYAYIWNAQMLGDDVFVNDPLVRVYTVVGSDTYAWARENNIPYASYLDEDAFYTETMLRLDVEAGYLGYCEGEHGDLQWLTVCESDCENDGYIIGVCEYCSEVLAEVHIPATGHNYNLITHIPATATQCGADIYRCDNCGDTYSMYDTEEPAEIAATTQTVSGRVVFADNKTTDSGTYPARGVAIQLDGVTLTKTDNDGNFTAELQRGTYSLTLHYAFGFDRIITVNVENTNVNCGSIAIIGCDFNRDNVIDDEDAKLFRILISAREGDDSYISYVDLNHDGIINATDLAILNDCSGINAKTYNYPICSV